MSNSLMIEYKRFNLRLWPPPKGPLVTLVVAAISETVSRTLLDIPSVAPLFLTIVYSTLREGRQAGLLSAIITVLYALYTFATPGQLLHYTANELARIVVIACTAPTFIVLIDMLKRSAKREQTEALRMQDYQSLLLQSISDAIIATDLDFRIRSWNRASETLYGWEAAEVQGRSIGAVIPTLRYLDGTTREAVLSMLKQQGRWNGRVIQAHRAGREIVIESAICSIHDADRQVIGYVAVNRDITEHCTAQKQLEASAAERERLVAALRHMPTAAIIAEAPSGRLILGNEQATRMLGQPFFLAESIAQYDHYQGFHADGRPYQPEEWPLARSIRAGETVVDEEIMVLLNDGTLSTICVSSAPIFDRQGTITAGVATFYDVTERKRTEETQRFLAQASSILADSLDYESTIASAVHLAIPRLADWCVAHLLSEDGSLHRPAVAHVNPALEELIRELQHRYQLDLSSESPILQVLRTGQTKLVPEVDHDRLYAVSNDEQHREALRILGFKAYMIVPMVAHGRTLGAVTFVSAKRNYTADDVVQAKELMRRCGLAVDNARLYREAQQAIRTRNELILIVSHDLKNPLSAIKGYANFLQRRAERVDLPELEWLQDGLAKIDNTTRKMTTLLNELLDFARLQAGQALELELRPTDLIALARQTVAEYQQATERHEISVISDVPELLGYYDTTRLERVLANLLSNAIKYSPNGGAISVELTQAAAPEQSVLISVQDHGLGIPQSDLPHIFEPFHRANNVVGRVRGTGIGLTSARQIVEQHGGTLTVVSAEGQGSTFTIRLPLISTPPDEDQPR